MYLTEIDKKTGLIDISNVNDGVLAIKAFRDVIENEELGLRCLTAIALTVDYLSPIKFYDDHDRPKKAMEETTGIRTYWPWNLDVIQLALKKYDELQYDPTLEEGRIHYNRKVKKLKEIQEYESLPKDSEERKAKNPNQLTTELRSINKDLIEYEATIENKDVYKESPVKNGYALTRLEQKLEKRNSFYSQTR